MWKGPDVIKVLLLSRFIHLVICVDNLCVILFHCCRCKISFAISISLKEIINNTVKSLRMGRNVGVCEHLLPTAVIGIRDGWAHQNG